MSYAPREPHRALITVIERLCAANRSDTCIVSIEKLRELMLAWFSVRRCRRSVCYHLKAAVREHLIVRQTRWKAVGGKLLIKARTRYRIGWRHFQRLASSARQCARLLPLITAPGRRETVQKLALGLQNLIGSVFPAAP
jgi:hypothetical protein